MSTQKQTVTGARNAERGNWIAESVRQNAVDYQNIKAQRDELLAAAKFVEVELSANEGRRGRWLADVLDKAIARAERRAE